MKKKILFVTNNMIGGGAEKILQVIVTNIYKKYDISICSLHEPKNLDNWPPEVKYYSIFKHNHKNVLERFLCLVGNKVKLLIYDKLPASIFYRCFVRGSYDTEIAFIEGYATRIVGSSTNSKSRKLAWLHTDMYNNHWSTISYRNIEEERRIYSRFDRIVGVSKGVADSITRLYPELNDTMVIYNPIDEKLIQKKATQKVVLDGDDNAFRLISVGRLVPEKGYDRLIPIIKELYQEGYNVQLYIIGDGSEREKLDKIIHDLSLENKVFLLGFNENPYPYIKQCDAFVSSSRIEGLSTVIVEALILGIPVVATDCAGMKELMGPNSEYGIVVANNCRSLKNGIISILNPTVYSEYKQMAKDRGNNFKLDKLLAEFEQTI